MAAKTFRNSILESAQVRDEWAKRRCTDLGLGTCGTNFQVQTSSLALFSRLGSSYQELHSRARAVLYADILQHPSTSSQMRPAALVITLDRCPAGIGGNREVHDFLQSAAKKCALRLIIGIVRNGAQVK